MWFISKHRNISDKLDLLYLLKNVVLGFPRCPIYSIVPMISWDDFEQKERISFILTYLILRKICLSILSLQPLLSSQGATFSLPLLWILLPRRGTQGPSKKIGPLPSYPEIVILRTVKTIMSQGLMSFIPNLSLHLHLPQNLVHLPRSHSFLRSPLEPICHFSQPLPHSHSFSWMVPILPLLSYSCPIQFSPKPCHQGRTPFWHLCFLFLGIVYSLFARLWKDYSRCITVLFMLFCPLSDYYSSISIKIPPSNRSCSLSTPLLV